MDLAFWQQFLITLGSNAMLIGLAGWLGKAHLDRIARNEQSNIDAKAREQQTELDERLQLLEQSHERLLTKNEQFHQISQETYQELFKRKIEVYDELLRKSIELNSLKYTVCNTDAIYNIDEVSSLHAFPNAIQTYAYGMLYQDLNTILVSNLTVLSPMLMEKFIEWDMYFNTMYSEGIQESLEVMLRDLEHSRLNNEVDLFEKKLVDNKESKTLENTLRKGVIIKSNIPKLKLVLDQIQSDSNNISKKIN